MVACFLVTVALLLAAADWLARTAAQNQLAGQIHQQTDSPAPPTVSIGGVVFLPQVLRGRYDEVAIAFPELSDGPLRLRDVYARLSGVHVPFRDILTGTGNPLVVDHADEQAFLTYDDLNSYLAAVGQPITVQGAGRRHGAAQGKRPTRQIDRHRHRRSSHRSRRGCGRRDTDPPPIGQPARLTEPGAARRAVDVLDPARSIAVRRKVTDIQVQDKGLLIRAQGDGLLITP